MELKKAEVAALIHQVVHGTEKAIEAKRPRFSIGFKGWNFLVEVEVGGHRQ